MRLDAGDIKELKPIISAVVREVLNEVKEESERLNGQLAYTQPQAAAVLGVEPNVLRDCRLRGELIGSRVGKKILYSREELLQFLVRRQIGNA